MKLMNEAVDQVRRQEQAHNASLKRTRYIWLKNPENLTKKQMKRTGIAQRYATEEFKGL
jgi:transposase